MPPVFQHAVCVCVLSTGLMWTRQPASQQEYDGPFIIVVGDLLVFLQRESHTVWRWYLPFQVKQLGSTKCTQNVLFGQRQHMAVQCTEEGDDQNIELTREVSPFQVSSLNAEIPVSIDLPLFQPIHSSLQNIYNINPSRFVLCPLGPFILLVHSGKRSFVGWRDKSSQQVLIGTNIP